MFILLKPKKRIVFNVDNFCWKNSFLVMGKKYFVVDRRIKMKSSDCFNSAQWLTVA